MNAPELHLYIGRVVVDAGVAGPGALHADSFGAALQAALAERLAPSPQAAPLAPHPIADAVVTRVRPLLDATRGA